jgi:hypothetical protein
MKNKEKDEKEKETGYLCPHCKPTGACQKGLNADDIRFLEKVSKKAKKKK